MTPAHVAVYLKLLDSCVVSGIVYLKQWARSYNPLDDVAQEFISYPFTARWKGLHLGPCPIQTRFEQGVWEVTG
jgi:hypothetical protein